MQDCFSSKERFIESYKERVASRFGRDFEDSYLWNGIRLWGP